MVKKCVLLLRGGALDMFFFFFLYVFVYILLICLLSLVKTWLDDFE